MSFDKNDWLKKEIRRISYRYPARYTTLINARVSRGKYKCALCEQIYPKKEVQMDHVEPVIHAERGFVDWNEYIDRMFPDMDGWQVLCKGCHKDKSNKENETRRATKKK